MLFNSQSNKQYNRATYGKDESYFYFEYLGNKEISHLNHSYRWDIESNKITIRTNATITFTINTANSFIVIDGKTYRINRIYTEDIDENDNHLNSYMFKSKLKYIILSLEG